MKQIEQMNVYKIGVSLREANEYLFPLSDGDIKEVGHYLKVIKFCDIDIAILIESHSYYSHFIVYTDDFSGVKKLLNYKKGVIRFYLNSSASERAKVQAIANKALSLLENGGCEISQLSEKLNNIPWKFIGFRKPVEMTVTHISRHAT